MILCLGPNDKIQIVTSVAVAIDCHISAMDYDGTNATPYRKNTAITTAATTDLSAAPASGITRNIKTINVRNKGAIPCSVTIQHTDGTTVIQLYSATLMPNQTLSYVEGIGWSVSGQAATGIKVLRKITPQSYPYTQLTDADLFNGEINLPANALGPNGYWLLSCGGPAHYQGTSFSYRWKLKLGATTIWDSGVVNGPNVSPDVGWSIVATLANAGVTNSQIMQGIHSIQAGGSTAAVAGWGTPMTGSFGSGIGGVSAEDTTTALQLQLLFSFGGTYNAADYVQLNQALLVGVYVP